MCEEGDDWPNPIDDRTWSCPNKGVFPSMSKDILDKRGSLSGKKGAEEVVSIEIISKFAKELSITNVIIGFL